MNEINEIKLNYKLNKLNQKSKHFISWIKINNILEHYILLAL